MFASRLFLPARRSAVIFIRSHTKQSPMIIDSLKFSVTPISRKSFHFRNLNRLLSSTQSRFCSGSNSDVKLKENIWTVPNLLTGSRILLTPVLGNLIVHNQYSMAAGVLLVAGFTDMIDGQIARTWPSQRSMFGTIMDPLADKCLMTTMTVTLAIVNLIPLWLTVLIVARDIGLICASFWVRYISLDSPKTFKRFFNVQHATVEFKPTTISKVNTVLQLGVVMASLGAPIMDFVDHPALVFSWYATAFTTVISGLSYVIWRTDTYSILKPRRK